MKKIKIHGSLYEHGVIHCKQASATFCACRSQMQPHWAADESKKKNVNNDIYLTILERRNDALLWVLKPDQSPLLNWMRLAHLNHRGWWVFLVHLSLMTGQSRGRRGNKMGKFSTLLGLLWLREAVIYPRRNRTLLSLQHTELFQQLAALHGWWHLRFRTCQQT